MIKGAVLVVDDEALIRMDLVEILQDRGFPTYEADNAAEAIAILEKHDEIRVVFPDIQMPGRMDGVELAHYVRKRWPPTVLIVCSGNRTPSNGSLPSACSFIAKPFERRYLGGLLDNVREQIKA